MMLNSGKFLLELVYIEEFTPLVGWLVVLCVFMVGSMLNWLLLVKFLDVCFYLGYWMTSMWLNYKFMKFCLDVRKEVSMFKDHSKSLEEMNKVVLDYMSKRSGEMNNGSSGLNKDVLKRMLKKKKK